MSIPVATTTITIWRSDQDGTVDDYDGPTWTEHRRGVRAVIGSHSGVGTDAGGSSQQVTARLDADPCDLQHDDRVVDDQTGITWHVVWCTERGGLGLDHTVADLLAITDRAGV